jgi:hypothetical protein
LRHKIGLQQQHGSEIETAVHELAKRVLLTSLARITSNKPAISGG